MFNALIRTHHITSRKKVAKLKAAGKKLGCYALLRFGGSPGMMYVEGSEEAVKTWVETVHNLRYKDYQLVSPPAPIMADVQARSRHGPEDQSSTSAGFEEVDHVKDFGRKMEAKGLWIWWRFKAGFTPDE